MQELLGNGPAMSQLEGRCNCPGRCAQVLRRVGERLAGYSTTRYWIHAVKVMLEGARPKVRCGAMDDEANGWSLAHGWKELLAEGEKRG